MGSVLSIGGYMHDSSGNSTFMFSGPIKAGLVMLPCEYEAMIFF